MSYMGRSQSAVRTSTAAAMLGVSASTLRSWESRYGAPCPTRSDGGHRNYALSEIEQLREALTRSGGEIAAAIALMQTLGQPVSSPIALRDALTGFDSARADRLLEESLAVRSVERTACELLLDGCATLDEGSPEQAFAWRYATGWLAAMLRTSPVATREECILLFDCAAPGSIDALHTQALELCLRRLGLHALALSPEELDPKRIGRAVRVLDPSMLVLSGRGTALDQISQLIYSARQAAGRLLAVADFRGAVPETGASTVTRLGNGAIEAAEALSTASREAQGTPAERPARRARQRRSA